MLLGQRLEVVVEINFSQLKVLVVNDQLLSETKIKVFYKKVLNKTIINPKTKQIINIVAIQQWLKDVFRDIRETLFLTEDIDDVIIVTAALNLEIKLIEKRHNLTTNAFSRERNSQLLTGMEIFFNNQTKQVVDIIPLRYVVDDLIAFDKIPVGITIDKSIKITGIAYYLDYQLIHLIKKIFKKNNCQIKMIVPESVGIAYEQATLSQLKEKIIFCNFNDKVTSLNFNYNEVIWSNQSINNGIFNIIKDIDYFLKCGHAKARQIFEKYGMLSISYNEPFQNKIIYKTFLKQFNKLIIFKNEFLTKIISARIDEILNKVFAKAKKITNIQEILFIFSGPLLEIPGLEKYLKYHYRNLNIKFYHSNTIGLLNDDFAATLGGIYYFNNRSDINNRIAKRIKYDDKNINKVITQLSTI